MRTPLVLCFLLVPAACASTGEQVGLDRGPTRETTVVLTTPDGETRGITITREANLTRATLRAPRDSVWRAMADAFTDVGLPAPQLDVARRLAAVQNHRVAFRLGQDPLSRFFECGMGATGLHADQRAIRMSLYVAVLPERDGFTPLELRAEGTAQSTEGTSSNPITCGSSGALEERLVAALQRRVVRPVPRT